MHKRTMLAGALVAGLALAAGVGIDPHEERRHFPVSPRDVRCKGTKMQQRKGPEREKRRVKNKMARKSRARGR